MISTVPQLLAAALGVDADPGPHVCFYCAAPCRAGRPVSEYVRDSFTGRNDVAAPGSAWVCSGCTLCLREACAVDTLDGVRGRLVSKAAMRAFSWVITANTAVAGSKSHLSQLRGVCLEPPRPPFAIVLSDSGKKHLLYRGVVCHDRDSVTLTLEMDRVTYRPAALAGRMDLCLRLAAAAGKPALVGPPSVRLACSVCELFPDSGESLVTLWESVYAEPLTRLAVWLCPGRDEARAQLPGAAASAATP